MFLPYRLDLPYKQRIKLPGVPFFSLLFGVMCVFIFSLQIFSEKQYEKDIINYCQYNITTQAVPIFKKIGTGNSLDSCFNFILDWDINVEKKNLDFFAYKVQLSHEEQKALENELERFNTIASHDPLTTEWWHDPLNSNITQYITSSFLHGDWEHLLFNLLFFFAFSIVLEQTIGSISYLFFFIFCCAATGFAYESNLFGSYSHLPTIGLSGVVMGVMTLTACIYPLKNMRCFLFFITIKIPLILLVSFYVLTDIYGLAYLMGNDEVNYIAHLAGAASGVIFAFMLYIFRLITDRNEPTKEIDSAEST